MAFFQHSKELMDFQNQGHEFLQTKIKLSIDITKLVGILIRMCI